MIHRPQWDDYIALAHMVYQKFTEGKNGKIMVLIRGFPGLGKSTLADTIVKYLSTKNISSQVCEADNFFYENFDPKKEYKHSVALLPSAHMHCQLKVTEAILGNVDVVIVSNTMLKEEDYYFYVNYAHHSKLCAIAIDLYCLYKEVNTRNKNELTMPNLLALCATSNGHGITLDMLNKMTRRFMEIGQTVTIYEQRK